METKNNKQISKNLDDQYTTNLHIDEKLANKEDSQKKLLETELHKPITADCWPDISGCWDF
jgi:hypothetical protein